MQKWAIQYCRRPHNFNDWAQAIIEAETAADAVTLLRRALHDDVLTPKNYTIRQPIPYAPEEIAGRVIQL